MVWDASKPDGQPRRNARHLHTSQATTSPGFVAKMSFEERLRRTNAWYRESLVRRQPGR